jgi:hypothetical protein
MLTEPDELLPDGRSKTDFPALPPPESDFVNDLPKSIATWCKANNRKPEGKRKEISPLSGDSQPREDRPRGRSTSKRFRKTVDPYQHIP